MAKRSILVVEDESEIRELIGYNLRREGFLVEDAVSGEQALAAAEAHPPDVVILDLLLPGMDGLAVCRALKSRPRTQSAAILMLTAKGEEADIVSGLAVGADDYITKPFSPKVLVARVRAVLRRIEPHPAGSSEDDGGQVIRIHEIEIDPGRHEVRSAGQRVELTATEFRILRLLAGKPGRVFSRPMPESQMYRGSCVTRKRKVALSGFDLR